MSATLASDGLPPLRDVIRTYGLNARKSLGQNFILDLNLTAKIASVCGPLAGKTVVEVGPGPGGLTRALLSGGAERIIAVERDERCRLALENVQARWPDKLYVEMADALAIKWPQLLAGQIHAKNVSTLADFDTDTDTGSVATGTICGNDGRNVVIIANLPYGIATRLLTGWLMTELWPPWYAGMGLMFQKEVAERIVSQPGHKAYGRLSVISQWCCEVKIALTLPAAAFTPPPKVSSAVVTFVPRPLRLPECKIADLERVTAAAFGQRRKMLRTSLKQLTPEPEHLLERAGIAPELRAEDVDVAGFARLAQMFGR